MQHVTISNTDGLITQAEYARRKDLSRSTVCRQIRDGKIPSHGGLIDPLEADQARANNLDIRKRRKVSNPESEQRGFPPLAVAGMEYLAKALRSEDRINELVELAKGLDTLETVRLVVFMANEWIEEPLEAAFGRQHVKDFDKGLSDWIRSWKRGRQ
jgi:hypothetical protein